MRELLWSRDESPDREPWKDIEARSEPTARCREWQLMLFAWIEQNNITDYNGALLRQELHGGFDEMTTHNTRRFLQENRNDPGLDVEYYRPGRVRVTEYMWQYMKGLFYDLKEGKAWLPPKTY